jgi:hypothetical protein
MSVIPGRDGPAAGDELDETGDSRFQLIGAISRFPGSCPGRPPGIQLVRTPRAAKLAMLLVHILSLLGLLPYAAVLRTIRTARSPRRNSLSSQE